MVLKFQRHVHGKLMIAEGKVYCKGIRETGVQTALMHTQWLCLQN